MDHADGYHQYCRFLWDADFDADAIRQPSDVAVRDADANRRYLLDSNAVRL